MSQEIQTQEAMSYQEYSEKYEDEFISPDEALRKAAELQEGDLENGKIFGSLVAHPEIYGSECLKRPTDRTLDYVTDMELVEQISQDYDLWEHNDSYFFDHDGWAIGLIPVESRFRTEELEEDPRISREELAEVREVNTVHGDLEVLAPEKNYALKLARYADSKKSGRYVKSNDLADIAGISLANRRDDVYDREKLVEKIGDTLDEFVPRHELYRDLQQRVDQHVGLGEWEKIYREIEELADSLDWVE